MLQPWHPTLGRRDPLAGWSEGQWEDWTPPLRSAHMLVCGEGRWKLHGTLACFLWLLQCAPQPEPRTTCSMTQLHTGARDAVAEVKTAVRGKAGSDSEWHLSGAAAAITGAYRSSVAEALQYSDSAGAATSHIHSIQTHAKCPNQLFLLQHFSPQR